MGAREGEFRCPSCNGLNAAGATWCAQCLRPLMPASEVPAEGSGLLPPAQPVPVRRHWARDPRQRWIFIGLGPVIILVTGLWQAGPDTYPVTTFLLAYPFVCIGLIGAMLLFAREGADRYEGREVDTSKRLPAIALIGLAVVAFPLAMTLQGESALLVTSSIAGVGIVILLFAWPSRGPSVNWFLVPLSVAGGAVCAGAMLILSVIGSLWGTSDGEPGLGFVVAWMVGGLFLYGSLVGGRATLGKPTDKDQIIGGAGAVAIASLACSIVALSFIRGL